MINLDLVVVFCDVLDPLFWRGGVFHRDGADLRLGHCAGWHGEGYSGELLKGGWEFIMSTKLQGQFEQM